MAIGVYKISLYDGRCYVGSSVRIQNRWSTHRNDLLHGTHHSPYLQNAWNKYGEDSFTWEILEECDTDILIELEQAWMDKLSPEFNVAPAAGSVLGIKRSPETREKNRLAALGHQNTLGYPRTPEFCANVSAGLMGHLVSEKTRAKISVANTGKKFPDRVTVFTDEGRASIAEANRRRDVTPEQRAKQSEAGRGRVQSPETRAKISASNTGKTLSKETRAKISASRKALFAARKAMDE